MPLKFKTVKNLGYEESYRKIKDILKSLHDKDEQGFYNLCTIISKEIKQDFNHMDELPNVKSFLDNSGVTIYPIEDPKLLKEFTDKLLGIIKNIIEPQKDTGIAR